MTDQQVIDERYDLIEKLGSGGMADVYLAEDRQLGRKVAIKVLHQRFAEDAEFVERFRREASAAAGLQHPNVVSVYDRGQVGDTYYIAMEYLEGRSLKQIVIDEAPLAPGRAIELVTQVLKAARFAHKRGIIHRDLKPHNVIVDDEDRAKVTDFGIARAGASDMTQTGSIMGTAQYLSPEQAQGQPVSAASDLYSVGIILYELLTGLLPFDADSAVAIALKQVSETPVPPSHRNPAVSPQLDAVVLRALEKDPAHRFNDAGEMSDALADAGRGVGPTTYVPIGPPPPPVHHAPVAEQPPRRGFFERWWPLLAGAVVVVAAIALIVLLSGGGGGGKVVPNVVGAPQAQAEIALSREGFATTTVRTTSEKPAEEVIGQDPSGGTQADEGATIRLTISAGPGDAQVPDLRNVGRAKARAELEELGFDVRVETTFDDTIKANRVIETRPDVGAKISKGSQVTMVVSKGTEPIEVPELVGLGQAEAEGQLDAAGLKVVVVEEDNTSEDPGTVLRQMPLGTTEVEKGSVVTIYVAREPTTARVPSVLGRTETNATNQLTRAGFDPQVITATVTDPGEDGTVVEQSPSGGTRLRKGQRVTITIGKFEPVTTTTPAPSPTP